MWYDERGGGEPLVLLHGGAVDSRFFAASIDLLADRFRVFAPDARGHGRTPDVEGPFTHAALARDAIAFLETVAGRPAHLVGHGEGASVAMHVGLRRPDLVNQLVVIGGDVRRDDHVPGDSQNRVDVGAVVAAFGASYGEVSPEGEEHYRVVVEKDVEMLAEGPTVMQSELGGITSRTLVMALATTMPCRWSTRSRCTEGSPTPSWPSSPARPTSWFRRSRRCATRSSSSS